MLEWLWGADNRSAVEDTQFVRLSDEAVPDPGRPQGVPTQDPLKGFPLEPRKHYLTVLLRALRLVNVRRGLSKFHGVVHSYATLPHYGVTDGLARFHKVSTPDKLKDLDAANLDRVLQLDIPLLGPIPYVGGRLEWQIGLLAIKAADLAAPYLKLLDQLSTVAGVSFIKAAIPFVEPIKQGVELLTGTAGNAVLEAGLEKGFGPPLTGWYLVIRAPRDEVRETNYKVDPYDYRLLDSNDREVRNHSYMLVSLSASTQRTDIPLLPDLREAHEEIYTLLLKVKNAELAEKAMEQFRLRARMSPDLLEEDAERVIQEEEGRLKKATLTAGGPPLAAPTFAELVERAFAPPQPKEVAAAVRYNRAAALAYARAYWTKACSDGYIAVKASPYYVKVPDGTIFVQTYAGGKFQDEVARKPDGSTIGLDDLEDCTHFISCCLGSPPGGTGGGLPIRRDFMTIYGRLSPQRLFDDLKGDRLIAIVGRERLSYADAAPLLAQLQAGDLIFYYSRAAGRYGHAGLYMADPKKRIACHTYCRCDQSDAYDQAWDSVNLEAVTLAKVVV
jgi:hypothetical protein